MIHYLGTTLEEVRVPVIENGVAGLRAYQAGPGQGLAVMLVDNWQESDHDRFRAFAAGQAPPAPAPVPAAPAGAYSEHAQAVAQAITELEAALANDGKVDEQEARAIIGHALQNLAVPGVVAQLVSGELDPVKAAKDALASFRGLLGK